MKIRDRILALERVRAGDLIPHPRNWRTHSTAQQDALRGILAEVGYVDALLVRETPDGLQLIDGHLRAETTPDSEVPVLVVDLNDDEADKVLATFDPLAAMAQADAGKLEELLAEVRTDSDALKEMLDSLADSAGIDTEPERKGNTDPDDIPEPPKEPITNAGDLWILGSHRLLCGDSTAKKYIERCLEGASIDAVVTDPPYGIGYSYDQHDDDRQKWFDLMNQVIPTLRGLSPFVVMPCCGIDRMGWWYANHTPDWLIAWYKGSPGHRSAIGFNDWEAHLVWGKPPKAMHDYFQTECGFREEKNHPCPKPVAYVLWLLERSCKTDGTVFDPFVGSGTTIIAAEQLNRRCFGMEISPRYCDVIVHRWEEFTGQKAVRHQP